MKVKKVINIFGGPGVGKSTVAAGVFFRLKCLQKDVELVTEFAKDLTYENRLELLSEDQLYIFANQHRRLHRVAKEVEYVIVDSPLLLTQMYFNEKTDIGDLKLLMPVVLNTFDKYPNHSFLLTRSDEFGYQEGGRSQSEEEAVEIDSKIAKYLLSHSIDLRMLRSSESTVDLIVHDVLGD